MPETSDPRSRYFTVANKNNDYQRDFELEKDTQFCGIIFAGNLQDRAMTELMCNEDGIEPIYDRSKEHLGTTDGMVITVRRLLIAAARRTATTARCRPTSRTSSWTAYAPSASSCRPAPIGWPRQRQRAAAAKRCRLCT